MISLLLFTSTLRNIPPELHEIAKAEIAFAKTADEKGVIPAFYEFFAKDSIDFQTYPVPASVGLEEQAKKPQPPREFTMRWSPRYVNISGDRQLGYSTGPVHFSSIKPPIRNGHNVYFSIWKKQPDQSWKVIIDIGIRVPQPIAPVGSDYEQMGLRHKPRQEQANSSAFDQIAKNFVVDVDKLGARDGFVKWILPGARLHFDKTLPSVGFDSIREFLHRRKGKLTHRHVASGVAASNDMGYSFGKWDGTEQLKMKGDYVHVFEKKSDGRWKLSCAIYAEGR